MQRMALGIGSALALAALASGAASVEPGCAEAKGWPLAAAVSDEFDGAALDRGKWDDWCRTFQGRSADRRFTAKCESGFIFAPENVAVSNGALTLTARMLSDAERDSRRNAYLRYAPYSVAICKSKAKTSYGYYEIRAKTMKACVSNAFWLYDPHSDDPDVKFTPGDFSEEVDVFETTGRPDARGKVGDCSKTYFNSLHLYATPYLEGIVNLRRIHRPRGGSTKVDFDFCDDWHTYGFLWTPEKLVWYLDGKVTREDPNEYFHRPMHVTFDAEVFLDWFGAPDPKDLPAQFRIDYVRVWEAPKPRNFALVPRTKIETDGYNWFERHEKILRYGKGMNPEIVFIGDSITHFWAGADTIGGEAALPRWKKAFGKYRTLNLGYGWDRTGNVLWRLDHGEMDGVDPRLVVIHIGGNNYSRTRNYPGDSAEDVAEGVLAVAAKAHAKAPRAKVVVMGVFPFGEKPDAPHRVKARATNAILAREVPKLGYAAFLDITARQVTKDGIYTAEMARDRVHPTDKGYDVWVEALKPYLEGRPKAARAPGAAPTPADMRGPFPIMSTPYFADGAVDYETLGREAQWVDDNGCPGAIWCQSNDAVDLLTHAEKFKGFEACAKAVEGRRITLALGANGTNTAEMLEIAAEIERVAARHPAAKIAMVSRPPDDVRTEAQLEAAWDALGRVAKRPVIFQTYGTDKTPTPSVALIARLARRHPHAFGYIKEEAAGNEANDRMVLEGKERPAIKTVFAGWGGWQWLLQLRHCGSEGLVTERCAYAPVLGELWRRFEAGERGRRLTEAFAMYRLLVDQRNMPGGLRGYSLYLLQKEGVFKNLVSRQYEGAKVTEGGSFGTNRRWKLETVRLTKRQMAELDLLLRDMLEFSR